MDGAIVAAAIAIAAFAIIQPELARIGNALWEIQVELKADREMRAAQFREVHKFREPQQARQP